MHPGPCWAVCHQESRSVGPSLDGEPRGHLPPGRPAGFLAQPSRGPTSHSSLQTTATNIPRGHGHPCVPPTRANCGPGPGGNVLIHCYSGRTQELLWEASPPRSVLLKASVRGRGEGAGLRRWLRQWLRQWLPHREGLRGSGRAGGVLHTRNYCWRPGS